MTTSFFGKLKNLHSGPPAPPRRPDNATFEWPQGEFDDEDSDMYEAPPCERRAEKVPPREIEENVYLERSSKPSVPERQAAQVPPRPGKPSKQQSSESKKPPEIDRTGKPGKMKMPPPPPVHAPAAEEDVYLDPNESTEDNEDLYLEPEAACSPAPDKKDFPRVLPMLKPPVPRAKTHSGFSSISPKKTTLTDEDRRASFPSKSIPPTHLKPLLPVMLKDPKPMTPIPSMNELKLMSAIRASKQSISEDREWFAGDCDRKMAEDLLQGVNKDGAFLIRNSSTQGPFQPYTLAVLYQQKVYNIAIRFLEDVKGYALGKEGKTNEEIFNSLDEIISFHKSNQILLIDSRNHAKHKTHLTQAVRP